MIDLNQTIEIEYTNHKKKPDGGVQMYVNVEGITNKYSMPIHLTPDQAGMMGDPIAGTKYKAKLVQSSLKDGKDGSWPSDFWYNVAIFEGVVDERNIKKESFLDSAPEPKAAPQPKVAPPTQAPSISREDLIVKQVIFKEASNHAVGDTNEEIVMNLDLLFKGFTSVFYGDYKSSPLVEEASKQGAKIIDIKQVEHNLFDEDIYDYPRPPMDVDSQGFYEYCEKAGWGKETIKEWLGYTAEDWINNTHGTYRDALVECRKKALEQHVYPPEDFRGDKR